MKQKLLKTWLVLVCLMAGVGTSWAEEPTTTIEFKNWTKAPSSAYSSTAFTDLGCTFTYCNNNWQKTGSWDYVRLGGKGGSSNTSTNTQTSTIKYNTASTKAINKVVLSHNGVSNSNVTVNSVSLDVYSNSTFTTKVATVSKSSSDLSISTSTSGTIEFTTNTSWSAGSYFMISVNLTLKGKSNIGFDATKLEFYEATGGGSANTAPTFTTQPIGAIYEQNAAASALTVVASGTPTPTYQWYSNTTNSNENGNVLTGETNASYTPNTTTAGTTYYYCIATNSEGNTKSNVVAIVVNASGNGGSGDGGSSSNLTNGYFVKITSQDDIVDGGKYLIVRENTDNTTYAAGINPDENKKYLSINEITRDSYTGNVNQSDKPYIYTLKASINDGYFYLVNDGKYLTGASGASDLTLDDNVKNGYSEWKLTMTLQKNVTIQNMSAKSGSGSSATLREIHYNTNKFAAYASGTGSVVTLYKWVPAFTVSAGGKDDVTNAYYATYYADHKVTVPAGCEAASVNVEDSKMYLSYTWTAGDVIPANTGVVIKANAAGTYTYAIATGEAKAVEGTNYLTGLTAAGTTVAPEAGDYKFYKLANGDNGIGFYYGADGGAAFNTGANKAYLAVPAAVAAQVKGFAFGEADEATAIFEIVNENNAAKTIYNLNGQRVSKAQKGIYIVNGKKVMFK